MRQPRTSKFQWSEQLRVGFLNLHVTVGKLSKKRRKLNWEFRAFVPFERGSNLQFRCAPCHRRLGCQTAIEWLFQISSEFESPWARHAFSNYDTNGVDSMEVVGRLGVN